MLDAIEPDPTALSIRSIWRRWARSPAAWSRSRRAAARCRCTRGPTKARPRRGVRAVHYEAAINRLTNAALDPVAKIPEFKYCAVRIERGGPAPNQGSFGGGQALERLATPQPTG